MSERLYSQNVVEYRYFAGTSEPEAGWKEKEFDDSLWQNGYGSIGFGDDDDSIIIDNTTSLYIRYYLDSLSSFPSNFDNVIGMVLNIDYDDGIIAYLNGEEIIRLNLDNEPDIPAYDQLTNRSHEASNYRFGMNYIRNFGYFIDSSVFHACGLGPESVLAFQVHNDSINGSDLSFYLYTSFITDSAEGRIDEGSFNNFCFSYTAQVPIDSSELPIIAIETDEFGYDLDSKDNIQAYMGIIDNNDGSFNKPDDPFSVYNGNIRTRLRGNLSLIPPKHSYALETQDAYGNNNNVALLGMPEENDWILYGPYVDKSLIRNELVFSFGRKLNYYEPRTRFCELILNGENQGLYVLTEKIKKDKNRVDIATLNPEENDWPDISGGYLFRIDHTVDIEIIYPKDEVITAAQSEYMHSYYDSAMAITYSNIFRDPVNGFRKYMDEKTLIDFILITELSYHIDGYNGSMYMYKDKAGKEGKIMFGPWWDYDLGFLNFFYNDSEQYWRYEGVAFPVTRFLQDTAFVSQLIDRWHELRQGIFHTDSIYNLIDKIIAPIQPYIERNYEVWPSINKPVMLNITAGRSYEEEISMMKSWIDTRSAWIDENISTILVPLDIYPNYNESNILSGSYINCYPNPFNEQLHMDVYATTSCLLKVCLYDLSGRMVYSHPEILLDDGLNNISLSADDCLLPGFYILKANINGKPFTEKKLIKVNHTP